MSEVEYLVAFNLSFCVVLKVAISLEPSLHEFSEFGSECFFVEEMVDTQA